MKGLSDKTLGEVARGFLRYRPIIIVLAVFLAVTVFFPGEQSRVETEAEATRFSRDGTAVGPAAAQGQGEATSFGGINPQVVAPGQQQAGPVQVSTSASRALDCDPGTGRLKFPSKYAAPCVAPWPKGADNTGATYNGVTKDKITVVVYRAPQTPQGQAVATAVGADDTREQTAATRAGYVDLFQKHYRTYGRTVEIKYLDGSGPGTDDAAGRADALKAAREMKAFISLGAPNNAYVETLAREKVLCMCLTSQPIETYLKLAPYAGYTTLMSSTQGYVHRAEYVRRIAGKPAQYAGDATYKPRTRTFAIVYLETADYAYKSGVDFFEEELGRYNIKLTDRISYAPDLNTAQEQATAIVSRLKEKQITSVIFSGDPIAPIFLTNESTNQNYFPEWVITGSALTDTSFFARTYNAQQWRNAFGVSYLAARGPQEAQDAWRLYRWHHNRTPEADTSYGVIYPNIWTLFTGIHMAGPKLTPFTFRDGLFAYPVSGGGFTTIKQSFGKHGLWPWEDYTAFDDATEIWWDPTSNGEDETGRQGVGLYRYVDGGKRYLPGQWPTTDVKPFVVQGTVTFYPQLPAEDKWPDYEHKHYYE